MRTILAAGLSLLLYYPETAAQTADTLSDGALKEVVVTAQYAPTDARQAVHAVRVLNRDRIERLGANNLEQLLRQELNLGIGQDMALGSSLSVQGLSGRNVKILIDGVPLIGRQDGNLDLGQINLANIERVEIIEGPSSVYYGTDALAGVVNLISRRGQAESWKIALNSQWETLGERSLGAGGGLMLGQKLLLLANGGYDDFAGFDSSATSRDRLWNPKKQVYADAALRWAGQGDHSIRLKGAFFREQVENSGAVRRPQFKPYAFDEFYRTARHDAALLHEGSVFQKYYWNNAAGLNFFRREKQALRTDLESGEQTPLAGEQDTTRFVSATLRSVLATHDNGRRWQWMAGVDTRYDAAFGPRIRDTLRYAPGKSALADAALLGSVRFQPASGTLLEAALRAGWNSRYRGAAAPSFHVKQRIGQAFDLRLTYARGFRSPDLKELFFYFVDASHFIIGNPGLRPERSNQVQGQLSWHSKPRGLQFTGQLGAFGNWMHDKIELYEFFDTPDGGITPVEGDTATFRYAYFNLDRYRTRGITLRTSARWRGWSLQLGGNLTGHYNPASAEWAATPDYTYTREINAALQWESARGWNAGLWWRTNDRFVRYFPEQLNGEAVVAQRTVSGYSNLDASAGKSFWQNKLRLQAGVRNLLDVRSAAVNGNGGGTHNGPAGAQPVSPGRSVWVRMTVELRGKQTGL